MTDALQQSIQTAVLRDFATPYLVVSADGEVVSFSPRTDPYLEVPPGASTRDLFISARDWLRPAIRDAFRESVQTRARVTRQGIAVTSDDGRPRYVSVGVAPLDLPEDAARSLFIVLFYEQDESDARVADAKTSSMAPSPADVLECELRDTRERLQALTLEYESLIEELRSAKEDLVSYKEEWESSKYELQSVNEELHASNGHLLVEVDALDRANGDLQHLFESTEVATIFLDKNRLIRSFTPIVSQIFSILPTDRGRPITDLTSRLSLPGFAEDISLAFANAKIIERRVEHELNNAHFLMRIAPYRNANRVLDGVVVNFTKVSTLSGTETRQHMIVAELQHRTRNLLTVVQSIAQQTLNAAPERDSFMARLSALARVQSLLSQELENRISIGEILRFELHAHGADDGGRVSLAGPSIALSRSRVQTLSLALHELTTNALKHGALRHPTGRLAVAWQLVDNGDAPDSVRIAWRESGVPSSGEPNGRGYGHKLIEEVIPYNLGARTELKFGDDGIECVIDMPLNFHARGRG